MKSELKIHLGVLAVLLATTFLLMRFTRLPTALWLVVPPVFFIYLGIFWIISGVKAKRLTGQKEDEG